MIKRRLSIILLACFLSACAAPHTKEMAQKNRQSIDDAMAEAAAVTIPEAAVPTQEILDDLVPGSNLSVPGLNADARLEATFDISVSNAPARLFFMSLVKDTNINMVVHPSVEGDISLDLKNVTVSEVMQLTREVYGYEFKQSGTGYIVRPARIQSRIFAVDYLNVSRRGPMRGVLGQTMADQVHQLRVGVSQVLYQGLQPDCCAFLARTPARVVGGWRGVSRE